MEILPNELLLECFKYLDGLHIFHSFGELNQRFSILIRSIPLYIDFENMTTENYYRIGMNIFSNVEIKKQIYSLKLANKNGYQRKLATTGHFTDGFIHLRSLSSKEMDRNSEPILHMNLSKLTELTCFHTRYNSYIISRNFATLPMSQLRVLTLSIIHNLDDYWNKLSSITNLTLHRSNNNSIHDLLTYATNLKYLHIWLLTDDTTIEQNQEIPTTQSKSLRSLTITSCWSDFSSLARILKRTVNLVSLAINRMRAEKSSFINEWEYLIANSLPNLKTFDFYFTYSYGTTEDDMKEGCKQIQTDFWLKKHRWYTNCTLSVDNDYYSNIYTVPYKWDSYQFSLVHEVNYNQIVDCRKMFDNVNSLLLRFDPISKHNGVYFSCVTSITLEKCFFNENYFQWLRLTVNLENVNSLCISANCKLQQSDILLEVLKQSPNISSLSIHRETLLPLLNNEELCEYLSKMIKQFTLLQDQNQDILNAESCNDPREKFRKIFANVQKLTCQIMEQTSIRFLLVSLPKLSNILINSSKNTVIEIIKQAEKLASELQIEIITEKVKHIDDCYSLWILRNHK